MKSIYEYENYRKYLADYFAIQKSKTHFFSQRYFAQKAGFSSHSFCIYLIRGERNLGPKSLVKLIKGLGLTDKKAKYFENMVHYDQCKKLEQKEAFFKEMNYLRKNSKFYNLNKRHYRYFENWYYPIIRHLVIYCNWNEDYSYLADLVQPAISKEKAKKAVDDLIQMGLVLKNDDGYYAHNSSLISTNSVPSVMNAKARRDVLENAQKSVESFNSNERFVTYSTLSMSESTYKKIVEILEHTKNEIYNKAIDDANVEKVYQMVVQVFPVTRKFNSVQESGDES